MAGKVINDKIESTLNDKQKRFCVEYLKDLNATRAYQSVYECSYDTARNEGSVSLAKHCIKKYINDLIDEYSTNVDITIGEIVQGLKDIAKDENARNTDKIKAMELLGKYKQMFVDKQEISITSSSLDNIKDTELEERLKELES